MAKLTQLLCTGQIAILTILVLISLVDCQVNNALVDQSHYTSFELLKNTGLTQCPVNETQVTSPLVPREPKRGGGGGGGGVRGGGTVGGLVSSTWVENQANYCKHMKGVPVMIPTKPTLNAFTPWWPTFTTQFVSLLITWIGLWRTSRGLGKHPEATDMPLPLTFWILLPIDIGRIAAWFFKTISGFADSSRFGWASVQLWLVPFNYIWLFQLLDGRKENSSPGDDQEMRQTNPFGHPAEYTAVQRGEQQFMSEPRTKRSRRTLYWVSVIIASITILQWCMSLAVVALHFKYSWFDTTSHPAYVELSRAIADPASIATMPQACLDWLKANTLVASKLLNINIEQTIMTLIVAIQFFACTIVLVIRGLSHDGNRRTFQMLKISALASLVTLGLPAMGTGFWVLGAVVFGNQDVWLKYTNNLNTTGGCTFGVVNMDRRWGYWDVQYERPYRIAMSALGAA